MISRKAVPSKRKILNDAAQVRHQLAKSRNVIVARLLHLTQSQDEKVAVKAIDICLDRMIGKAESPTKEATGSALLEAFKLMQANAQVNQRAVAALTRKYAPQILDADYTVVEPDTTALAPVGAEE